jgi:hypothetical protein
MKMETSKNIQDKPLECPVSIKGRNSFKFWFRRMGLMGFVFFLIKGLLWLIVPYLLAKGIL